MPARNRLPVAILIPTLLLLAALGLAWALTNPSPARGDTLTVTSTADSGAGSLRQAIADAAPGDTVDLTGLSGVITLTSGRLSIGKDLTISGPGAAALAIDGNASSPILDVGSGVTASVLGLTITNGNNTSHGGGIRNRGALALTNSTVSGNSTDITGGGIWISGFGSTLTLTNSTVSGNTAFNGGGIWNNSNTTVTLTNGTVSDNTATNNSGGILNAGTLTLTNSTVSDNMANRSVGGILTSGLAGPVSFKNTIIAGNSAASGSPDCSGTMISQGHNLVQDTSGCTITGDLTGNITGQDPLLGPLADNGGPTLTHALDPNSPAIDSGDDSVLGAPLNLTTDQRGLSRLHGAHVDIGAYEYGAAAVDTPQTSPITVTKPDDTSDGFCGVLDCSLREAITSADSSDTINIPAGVYTLTQGTELLIDKSLTLNGAGSATPSSRRLHRRPTRRPESST